MIKRLIFISSLTKRQLWLGDLLSYLKTNNQPFVLFTKSIKLLKKGKNEKWLVKKSLVPTLPPFLFFLSLPFWWLIFGLYWPFYLWCFRPQVLVLFNWPEKIIFTPLALLFKIKVFWLEYPERQAIKLSWFIKFFYRQFSSKIKFIVFGQSSAEQLHSFVGDKDIVVLLPTGLAKNWQQPSIFKKIAEQATHSRFVVGAVLYGLPKGQAERLLAALSIAQTICPLIELVIIGEGKNRKQIQWLAKRLNLERRVWLAGPTSDWQRWLCQLDVYIIANKKPSLEDAAWAISAMSTGLPIIGPANEWLKDFITPKTGVLIDINNSDVLARQLITWQQENEVLAKLGKEAKLMSAKLSFENLAQNFIKLLS